MRVKAPDGETFVYYRLQRDQPVAPNVAAKAFVAKTKAWERLGLADHDVRVRINGRKEPTWYVLRPSRGVRVFPYGSSQKKKEEELIESPVEEEEAKESGSQMRSFFFHLSHCRRELIASNELVVAGLRAVEATLRDLCRLIAAQVWFRWFADARQKPMPHDVSAAAKSAALQRPPAAPAAVVNAVQTSSASSSSSSSVITSEKEERIDC